MNAISNVDPRLQAKRDRIMRQEIEIMEFVAERREGIKEIYTEIKKDKELPAESEAGVRLNVRENLAELKRAKENAAKRAKRETAKDISESLGAFASEPLGMAAVERARANGR